MCYLELYTLIIQFPFFAFIHSFSETTLTGQGRGGTGEHRG